MEKLHLNWDGGQDNGIIFNSVYTWGALFKGVHLKPVLSFEFDYMQYSEVFEGPNYVIHNRVKRSMTDKEATEVKALAVNWVQEVGQEGNPSQEQINQKKVNMANGRLSTTNIIMTTDMEDQTTQAEKDLIIPVRANALEVMRDPTNNELMVVSIEVKAIVARFTPQTVSVLN